VGQGALLAQRQWLAQPGHGAVEVLQGEGLGAVDGLGLLPFFGGAVAARIEEAVQDGQEDGALQVEFEFAFTCQIAEDLADAQLAPEAPEDEGGADAAGAGGEGFAALVGAQDGEFFGEARERGQQGVELAAGLQPVQAAQRGHGDLLDARAGAPAFDDHQVLLVIAFFDAHEHGWPPFHYIYGADAAVLQAQSVIIFSFPCTTFRLAKKSKPVFIGIFQKFRPIFDSNCRR
jgi:hypothetical protein